MLFILSAMFMLFSPTTEATQPKIIETNTILDIEHVIDQNTLVLLDIDQTLIDPGHHLGTGPFNNYLKDIVKQLNSNPETKLNTPNLFDLITLYLARNVPMEPVEVETPALVSSLQGRNITVLGLTTRGRTEWYSTQVEGIDELTKKQLNSIQIHLENAPSPFHQIDAKEIYGILFTSHVPKGDYLISLFEKTSYRPSNIVFVDDRIDHVQSVEKAAKALNLPFNGFLYKRVETKGAGFDPLIATIQLIELVNDHILLSNEEAAAKKNQFEGVNPAVLLKDFVQQLDQVPELLTH